MDLRDKKLSPEQLQRVGDFIVQRRLGYQPFVFSDDLEVGAGQHFADAIRHSRLVYWRDHDPRIGDLVVADADAFRKNNACLRRIYESFLDFIAIHLKDFSDLSFAEVGCNTGYFLYGLALRGAARCIGYDYSPVGDIVDFLNQVLGTRCEFQFGEWDSLEHTLRYAQLPEVDVTLSVAVTCHLADPIQHLSYLCDHSRRGIFVYCPVNPSEELALTFGSPSRYSSELAWPLSFDNNVRFSVPLLRECLIRAGFADIRELECPEDLPDIWRAWFKNQRAYFALRTDSRRTAMSTNGGKRRRDFSSAVLPPEWSAASRPSGMLSRAQRLCSKALRRLAKSR